MFKFFYPATLVRVIDADTIKVQLTLYPELFLVNKGIKKKNKGSSLLFSNTLSTKLL